MLKFLVENNNISIKIALHQYQQGARLFFIYDIFSSQVKQICLHNREQFLCCTQNFEQYKKAREHFLCFF